MADAKTLNQGQHNVDRSSWLSSGTCFAAQRAITPPLHLLTLQSQEKPRWLCWLVTLPVLVARMGKGTFPALALGVCFIFLALVPSGWLLAAVDGGFYFSSLLYPPWEKLLQLQLYFSSFSKLTNSPGCCLPEWFGTVLFLQKLLHFLILFLYVN